MNDKQRKFLATLKRLEDAGIPAKRGSLGLADREADRVRQSCRSAGWVRFGGSPSRWRLNQSGRKALADLAIGIVTEGEDATRLRERSE